MSLVMEIEFIQIESQCCGTRFCMSRELYDRTQRDNNNGAGWYCPGCGKNRIWADTVETRLKKENEKLSEELSRERRSPKVSIDELTKLKTTINILSAEKKKLEKGKKLYQRKIKQLKASAK